MNLNVFWKYVPMGQPGSYGAVDCGIMPAGEYLFRVVKSGDLDCRLKIRTSDVQSLAEVVLSEGENVIQAVVRKRSLIILHFIGKEQGSSCELCVDFPRMVQKPVPADSENSPGSMYDVVEKITTAMNRKRLSASTTGSTGEGYKVLSEKDCLNLIRETVSQHVPGKLVDAVLRIKMIRNVLAKISFVYINAKFYFMS